jgi:copper chaperone CopZ
MTYLLSLFLTCVLGYGLLPSLTEAADARQRVSIRLSGRYCLFHMNDLTQALTRVSGVMSVDFETVMGHVIIEMKAGKVNPDHLLAAIQQTKGEGYHCTGRFEGEPGKLEY